MNNDLSKYLTTTYHPDADKKAIVKLKVRLKSQTNKALTLAIQNRVLKVLLVGYSTSGTFEIARIAKSLKVSIGRVEKIWYDTKREVENARKSKL